MNRGGEPAKIALGLLKLTVPTGLLPVGRAALLLLWPLRDVVLHGVAGRAPGWGPGALLGSGTTGTCGLTGGLHGDVLLRSRGRAPFGERHIHGQDALVVGGFDVLFAGARRQGGRAGK